MPTFKGMKNRIALLVTTIVLGACGGFQPDQAAGPSQIPRAVTTTTGGVDVVIAAPDGFCIDRATIDENAKGTFMFLSDCRTVAATGKTARVPISAILTASISPSGLVGGENGTKTALSALGGFLATPVGLFTLGKSHVDGAVSILETKQTDLALYVLVKDSAFSDGAGVSNRYWRAFTEVNGRLVALSVTGYSDSDPDEGRSLRIVRDFVQSIHNANSQS